MTNPLSGRVTTSVSLFKNSIDALADRHMKRRLGPDPRILSRTGRRPARISYRQANRLAWQVFFSAIIRRLVGEVSRDHVCLQESPDIFSDSDKTRDTH